MRDDQLIQLLVKNGTDVSSNIQLAVSQGDETLIHILLKGQPSVAVVSEALLAVFRIEDLSKRLRVVSQLLSAGADIHSDGGKAILLAAQYYDLAALDILLERHLRVNASLPQRWLLGIREKGSTSARNSSALGVTGGEVSKALIFIWTREPQNLDLF
jgi:hypothetical protein